MAAVIGQLKRPLGRVGKRVFAGVVSVADSDTIDTGLKSIDVVTLTPTAQRFAYAAVSGGTITVHLLDSTGAAVTSAENVYVIAIGE